MDLDANVINTEYVLQQLPAPSQVVTTHPSLDSACLIKLDASLPVNIGDHRNGSHIGMI
jgi:hypothetical protein